MELYSEIFLNNLKSVRKETDVTFNDFLKERESEIRFLIKERWSFGKRPDGTLIGQYSSSKYAEEKHKLNPKPGLFNVDLIDHQDLVDGIKIVLQTRGFKIISSDEKFAKISKKYGLDNFNLSEDELEQIINEVSVATIEYLYNKYLL